ncbi:G protein-coupled receptor [Aphelenchoides fujianensis]|nr:G protein-coupled receptor [Aphelenchoides fujianensis]
MGITAELLYAPVIYAFCTKGLRKKSCFRLMFLMAVYDVLSLPVTTFLAGYFAFTGRMFCDAPRFVYLAGIFGFTCWSGYTVTSLLLSINRCLAFTPYSWVFTGKLQYVFLALPLVYSAGICAFARAPIWNSLVGAYMFNPHLGYFEDKNDLYYSSEQILNNLSLSILLPTIYIVFYVHHSMISKGRSRIPKREYSLFLQVLLMNSILSCASVGYVLMQFVHIPEQLIFASHLAWVSVQCAPPIIYLTMNQTIRAVVFPGKSRITSVSLNNSTSNRTTVELVRPRSQQERPRSVSPTHLLLNL